MLSADLGYNTISVMLIDGNVEEFCLVISIYQHKLQLAYLKPLGPFWHVNRVIESSYFNYYRCKRC